jgi:hypothetical protein
MKKDKTKKAKKENLEEKVEKIVVHRKRVFQGNTGTFFIRNVPVDLRNKFDAACALRGKWMTTVILELVRNYVRYSGKINGGKIAAKKALRTADGTKRKNSKVLDDMDTKEKGK